MQVALSSDTTFAVSLSRKNLEGLLELLDDRNETPQIMRRLEDGRMLMVIAEENETHYEGRVSGASAPSQVYGESHAQREGVAV